MSSVSGAQSKCQLYTDRFLLLDHTFLYGAVYLAVQGGFNYFRIKITKEISLKMTFLFPF